MGTAKKRRWGMLVCMLLSIVLVIALVPQAAWAEVAAESTDAAQTGVTTTDTDGTTDQTDDTEDGSKSDDQGDISGDQDDQADNQGTQGSQDADASNQQSKAGNAMVLSAMDDDSDITGGTDASSHVHCTITSSETTYLTGDTGDFNVSYTIDPGSIKEGDTLTVSVPTSISSKVKLYVSKQHFKDVKDNGDGTWTLTFGPDAATALTGTFEMFVTMNSVTSETTGTISTGDGSLQVTVKPRSPEGGATQSGNRYLSDSRVIVKDVVGTDGKDNGLVGDGAWDRSSGDVSTLYRRNLTNAVSTEFRFVINEKQVSMTNPQVVDTLPEGMTFDTSDGHGVTVQFLNADGTSNTVPASDYDLTMSGTTLTFTYKGTTNRAIMVLYWATSPAGSNATKLVNRADLSYTSGGTAYTDHALSTLQGINYSAANGTKMVDKTELYLDDDQQVTYTFKFWNNNGFAVGDISLKDYLNKYVDYKTALDNDKFSVTWDENNHCVNISNKVAISSDDVEYVSFVTDFSRVPGDTQVDNRVASKDSATGTYTIYGNTVHTYRYKAYRVPRTDDTTDNSNGGDTDTTNDDNQTDTTNDDDGQTETTDGGLDRTTDTTNDDSQTKTTDTTEEQTSTATSETKTAAATQQSAQAPMKESAHQDAAPKGSLPQTGDVSSPVLPVLIAGLLVLAVACALRVRRQGRA